MVPDEGEIVEQILRFLLADGGYLLVEDGFRIVDSLATNVFGGDGYLVLENAALRLRFTVDRGQMFLDVQPAVKKPGAWYSIDLVRQLVEGEVEHSAVFDAHFADFLHELRSAIYEAFSPESRKATHKRLAELRKDRERRMFGHSKMR